MSRSADALLSHSERWFADLEESYSDVDELLAGFALEIETAADAYVEVIEAIEGASFAGLDGYPELLEELRASVQFLSTEAAVFAALVAGELDDEPEELIEEDAAEIERATVSERTKGAPTFDRRIPDALLDALGSGGAFGWVSELVRGPTRRGPPLDLGLRASPKRPDEGHATLYLGTTQVLGIHVRDDGLFRLTPHHQGTLFTDIDPAFDNQAWSTWQPLRSLADLGPEVERHVRAAIEGAPRGRQREGRYQSALSKPQGAGYALVDREVTLTFATGAETSADRRAPCAAGRDPAFAEDGRPCVGGPLDAPRRQARRARHRRHGATAGD